MTLVDYNSFVKTALNAVLAGANLAESTGSAQIVGQKGSLRDIVTQTDLEISELLVNRLGENGTLVISEEAQIIEGPLPEVYWVVDPIDGTVNFSHGLHQYAITVGLVEREVFTLGVVCAPKLGELYFTLHPEKALLNGRPFIHSHGMVADALVAASFAATAPQSVYDMFRAVNENTRGCLRTGSAAINICWAAVGNLQGAYGFGARLWDVAGALAIARAAGCDVVIHRAPDSLKLDYFVGSREVVSLLSRLASENHLLTL
ncbi:MAG: hypothetical protein K9J77_11640 [Rhodoferax sp.]|nr:hypothetical protein [Rhodoferax sp.]